MYTVYFILYIFLFTCFVLGNNISFDKIKKWSLLKKSYFKFEIN